MTGAQPLAAVLPLLAFACGASPSPAPGTSAQPFGERAKIATPEVRREVQPPSSENAGAASAVPRVLLGRVPGTRDYRVLACSRGPGKRDECSRELESHLGERLSFAGGNETAVLDEVVELITGDGGRSKAFRLAEGRTSLAVFPAFALKVEIVKGSLDRDDIDVLKGGTRRLSPLPSWATGWSFEAAAFLANLTGHEDRVALTRIEDRKANGSRELHAVFVAVGAEPFQLVEMSTEADDMLGKVDIDGDARDEVIFLRKGPMDGAYAYRSKYVIDVKPLAMTGNLPNEAWQTYDQLEDHNHSDE